MARMVIWIFFSAMQRQNHSLGFNYSPLWALKIAVKKSKKGFIRTLVLSAVRREYHGECTAKKVYLIKFKI